MGYLNTFLIKRAYKSQGGLPYSAFEGIMPRLKLDAWNNYATQLSPIAGRTRSWFRNADNLQSFMRENNLHTYDELDEYIRRGQIKPTEIKPTAKAPAPVGQPVSASPSTSAPVDQPVTAKPAAPSTPAPVDQPVTAKPAAQSAAAAVDDAAKPAAQGAVSAADDAAEAAAGAAKTAPRKVGDFRKAWAAQKAAAKNLWRGGKSVAMRHPKLAALAGIASLFGGGALLGGAIESGRPKPRLSNAANPYQGFESY